MRSQWRATGSCTSAAMLKDAKINSLSNKLSSRMMTTSERVDITVRRQIVDDYTQKLLKSGFGFPAIRKKVSAELKGLKRRSTPALKQDVKSSEEHLKRVIILEPKHAPLEPKHSPTDYKINQSPSTPAGGVESPQRLSTGNW